jgi:hypothetical protein
MKTAKCKGCGRKIVWGVTREGKKIPLDAVAPVYMVSTDTEDVEGSAMADRARGFMVSHFATCPEAARFSGSRSKS